MSRITMPIWHATSDGLNMFIKRCVLVLLTMLLAGAVNAQQSVQLESIGFATLPGDSIEIRLGFDGTPPEPNSFVLDNPARISVDLDGVASSLTQQQFNIDADNAQSVLVIDDGSRTRLIINLDQLVSYDSTIVGNNLVLTVGADSTQATAATASAVGSGWPCRSPGLQL